MVNIGAAEAVNQTFLCKCGSGRKYKHCCDSN
ncbi:SEC-C metal-binding domain-containing protein [Aestuariivita sp.]